MEFIKILCLVDESTILLPYKTFFAVKGNVLTELDKLGQSYMAVNKYFQGFSSRKVMETMYVSVLIGFDSPPEDFYPLLCKEMDNLSHKIYTWSIQAPFLATIGWVFQSHEHTDLVFLSEILEGLLGHLIPNGPTIALGFKWKNIWDCTKNPQPLSFSPNPAAGSANPNSQSKHQFIKVIHVEVAKKHKDIAADLVCKALHSKAFQHTTNLMVKF